MEKQCDGDVLCSEDTASLTDVEDLSRLGPFSYLIGSNVLATKS